MPSSDRPDEPKKKPYVLTDAEQAACERGLRSEASGVDYSLEEVFEFARKIRKLSHQDGFKKCPCQYPHSSSSISHSQ